MKTRGITVLVGVVSALAGGIFMHRQLARACCLDNSGWSSGIPMHVLLNVTLTTDLCHTGSTCSSFNDIRFTSEAAINKWYMDTGSTFRIYYEGSTTANRGDVISGKTHVYANSCTGSPLALAAWDNFRTWGKIRICTSNDSDGTINWHSAEYDQGSPNYSFHNVLALEMGHIVGEKHTQDCTGSPKGINSAYYDRDLSHLFKCDQDFLQGVFGGRTTVAHARYTTDGITWTDGLTAPTNVRYAMVPFSASNSRSGLKTFVSYVDKQTRSIYFSKYDGAAWTEISTLPFGATPYLPGTASASDLDARVDICTGYNASTGMENVDSWSTANGGSSWSIGVLSDDTSKSKTTNAGVSTTYDPNSAQYISTWLGAYNDGTSITRTNEIFYKAGSHPVQRLLDGSGNAYIAGEIPSVACGPTSVAGTENCLFAFVDGNNWQRTVKWFQAYVNTSGVFVASSVKSHGFIAIGPATVTYWGNPTYPWLIALGQDGTTTYTWRKQPASSFNFQDQRSFSDSIKALPPGTGSRVSGSTNFAMTVVGHE